MANRPRDPCSSPPSRHRRVARRAGPSHPLPGRRIMKYGIDLSGFRITHGTASSHVHAIKPTTLITNPVLTQSFLDSRPRQPGDATGGISMRRVMLMRSFLGWTPARGRPALRSIGHVPRNGRADGRGNKPYCRALRRVTWGSSMRAFGRFWL